MKRAFRVCVLASVALFGAAMLTDGGQVEAAPTSYKMRCRGGNNTSVTYYLNMPSGSATVNAATLLSKYEIRMRFGKSPVKGSGAIPEGTCAWMDRPFNARETPRLRWLKAPFPSQVSLYPQAHKYGTIKVAHLHNAASAEQWKKYKDKIGKSNEYFTFWGHYKHPWLYITKVGP